MVPPNLAMSDRRVSRSRACGMVDQRAPPSFPNPQPIDAHGAFTEEW